MSEEVSSVDGFQSLPDTLTCRAQEQLGVDASEQEWRRAHANQFGSVGRVCDAADCERHAELPACRQRHLVRTADIVMSIFAWNSHFCRQIVSAYSYQIHPGYSGDRTNVLNTQRALNEDLHD